MRLRNYGFLILLLAMGCGGKNPQGAPGAGGARPPVPVVAAVAQGTDLKESVSVIGSIEPNEVVEIRAEIDGTVETVAFEEGQKVKKGDLLIQLDPSKLQAELEQAQSQLVLAQSTKDRLNRLSNTGAVSQQEIDRTQAELAAAKAQVTLAEERLEDARIVASFDGVTAARLVSPGQYVSRGAHVTTLVDQDPVKAVLNVPERFVNALTLGQSVELRTAAYGDTVFIGQVSFIDPQIETDTRTVLVKALVPNPDDKLRSGMFTETELILKVHKQAVVIPESAVMWQGGNSSVFVVDGEGKAELRMVKLGVRREGVVQILSGVSAGDKVITEGTQKIGPGAPVSPRIADSAPKAQGSDRS